MHYKIGFIGCGNMAQAIIGGLLASPNFTAKDIIASVSTEKSRKKIADTYGIHATRDNLEIMRSASFIVLAVKPYILTDLFPSLGEAVQPNQTIISIAAGVTLEQLAKALPVEELYRAMPNTPARVGAGMTSICYAKTCPKRQLDTVKQLFEAVGGTVEIEERQMHAAIAAHGSSPAYFYMMLEAMGDAGVKLGLSRDSAYEMAAQAMLGAAKTYLETREHPGVLKDAVTSPMGTTIEAVSTLESCGFRHAIIEAMSRCATRSQQMSED